MGYRANGEIKSLKGRQWKVQLHKFGYSGSEIDLTLKAPGFKIKYLEDQDPMGNFLPSEVSVTVVISQSESSTETLIEDMAVSQWGQYALEILEWNGASYDRYWMGVVQTDMISVPDKWPSEVTIKAVDGLAYLKNLDFSDGQIDEGGTLYSDKETFIGMIHKALMKSGLENYWGNSETLTRTIIHWYEANQESLGDDPLQETRISHELWYKKSDYVEKEFEVFNAYDVLKEIVKAWGARIMMVKGKFWIFQPGSFISTSQTWRDHSRDLVTFGSGTENFRKTVNQTTISRLSTPLKSWTEGVRKFTVTHTHNAHQNILGYDKTYKTAKSFPPGGDEFEAGTGRRLRIKGVVELRYFNRTSTDIGLIRHNIGLALTLTDGTNFRYLKKLPISSTVTWESSVNNYQDFAPDVFVDTYQDQNRTFLEFDFETPDLPEVSSPQEWRGFFQVIPGNFFDEYNNTTALTELVNAVEINWGDDPYNASYDNKFIWRFRTWAVSIQYTREDKEESGQRIYKSLNSNDGGTTIRVFEKTKEMEILFGDNIKGSVEPGSIEIYDGSNWVKSQGQWGISTLSGTEDFGQLCADEYLKIQSDPNDLIRAKILGDFDPVNPLVVGSDVFIFMGGSFIARQDTWDGLWMKIADRPSWLPGHVTYTDLGPPKQFPQGPVIGPPTGQTGGASGSTLLTAQTSITGVKSTTSTLTGTITSVPITALGSDGLISSGDVITLLNPQTGATQELTVTADVGTSDTSISVSSTLLTEDYPTGSQVMISGQELLEKIASGGGGDSNIDGGSPDTDFTLESFSVNGGGPDDF